jgi:hypothetical protein
VTKEYTSCSGQMSPRLRTYRAHTSIWRDTHIHTYTHFSICLPNLRDYYHAEAEDAKEVIDI